MKEFTITNAHGHSVACACTDNFGTCDKVIIMMHGFGSSRESITGMDFNGIEAGDAISAVSFDFPGHGASVDDFENLRIDVCLDNLKSVEEYVFNKLDNPHIYYYAMSFGAYITFLYMTEGNFRGERAFMCSAAVNMPELTFGDIGEKQQAELDEKGYTFLDTDELNIPKGLLDDFAANSVFDKFDPAAKNAYGNVPEIMMIHSKKDEEVDYKLAAYFARKNHIKLHTYEDEDHRMMIHPETHKEILNMACKFYG